MIGGDVTEEIVAILVPVSQRSPDRLFAGILVVGLQFFDSCKKEFTNKAGIAWVGFDANQQQVEQQATALHLSSPMRNSDTMNLLNKMENSVRVSLKNLGVSYLDLYLMHWPESSAFGDATDPPTKSGSEYRQFLNRFKTTWTAMESLVELGLVLAIGVSHFNIEQIKELLSEFL
ncbi:aldo-keto reductase family 1 member A1-like [Camellia sinensis]|uniref:aldo-keto reductase family 1 member A1-like n=1 Tax=Camellia sinensis TaxID=4442 RepID=UPI001036B25A|nr:aldo-keto reductase family 1 member A1-like [Camellia sinensis]